MKLVNLYSSSINGMIMMTCFQFTESLPHPRQGAKLLCELPHLILRATMTDENSGTLRD
jgi:hypothetical protein